MLDKSIPYYNVVMKRCSGAQTPLPSLPSGYSFVPFKSGDEKAWAEIEASVLEFESQDKALDYFTSEYLPYPKELERRCFFIQGPNGKKLATCTCWWNYTGERRDPALHWVGAKPECQGHGLGKALIFEAVQKMLRIEGDRDIFLHTQTWSYKAIGIYQQAGFRILEKETFGEGGRNDFDMAVPKLKEKMNTELILTNF